ncbi:MAG: HEAT repeat domain-containing protein [Planctomycetes bacterium]|nr:HEAT repeat domain-containing protein [Planctomycetota bacterium]
MEELIFSFPSPNNIFPQFPQEPVVGVNDAAGALEGYNRWEFWFETNKDVLLRSRDFRRRQFLQELPPSAVPTPDDGKVRLDEVFNKIAPALRLALKSPDPRVVRQAAMGLGRIGNRESIPMLEELAKHASEAETRRYAIVAMSLIEDRTVMSILVNLVMNPEVTIDIRAAAALGLGFQGRREGARFLKEFLEKTLNGATVGGSERDVYIAAILGLGMLRDRETAPMLIGRYRALREVRTARAKPAEVAILQALGRIGDPSALVLLVDSMLDKDEQIRRACAQALGDLGDRAVVKMLINALENDSDEQTRGFAAISLGRIGGEAARDALRAAFANRGSRTVKSFAALGLGLLGDKAFAPELLKAFSLHSEDDMRGSFAIALGLLQETKAVAPLMKVVEARGANADFRGYCAIAVGMIHPEGVLDKLIKILEEDADRVDLWRRALCIGIGLFGQPKAGASLTHVLETDKRDVVREHAALALNLCRGRDQIDPLIKILEREQMKGDIALFAASALSGLGDRYEFPLLSETFFNVNYRVRNTFLEELQRVL